MSETARLGLIFLVVFLTNFQGSITGFGATVLALPLLFDGRLGRFEGLLLWFALAVFLLAAFRSGGSPTVLVDDVGSGSSARRPWRDALGVAVGVAVLAYGAHALVTGATALALIWGVPEEIGRASCRERV